MERTYIAIDLKSFYASVECVERGLDPLTAKLVVADESRTEKTICLAVSPALRAEGVPGRARLYQVLNKIRRDDFIIASPRMQKYIEISTKIFEIYTGFIAPEDIHVYSIDEVFIDATSYLKTYKISAHELTLKMIRRVLEVTGITATAGIGSNLYLAKIAMDIEAKHMSADRDGVRIAELNERSYRERLWDHKPITDFWRIGRGYAKRLKKYGIETMGDLAHFSLAGHAKLYDEFGVNAELLIDHAWGWEPVSISDIKSYHSSDHSVSSGQVLSKPYDFSRARLVVAEMADSLSLDLAQKRLRTDQIVLTIGYDVKSLKNYKGPTMCDYYGRKVPKQAHGTVGLGEFTNLSSAITDGVLKLFDRIIGQNLMVRRIYLTANHVCSNHDAGPLRQLDFFTDYSKKQRDRDKESRRQQAILEIKQRYGKNAILRAMSYEEGATARQRNRQVGGHKA